MQFRHDINCLRAIAVIAVVLFHFNTAWLPGGFAGVDVFFVISGFLMTGIIFRGIEKDNFSIINFYVARANRIIPALAMLCLVLLAFGWFYLSPIDYKVLGKHVGGSVGFLSNILYWRESGYFDSASHEKWLLHTWSLSVEWQFYIIYPIILVAMHKLISIKTIKVVVLLGAVSGFAFSVLATYKWPDSAYYLLPTRAWEMMIGGVAYLYPLSIKQDRKKYLEWFALTLIIASYFLISKEDPWPGYMAIFPVIGSFLIIQAQHNNSYIARNIIFQKLGTWSYSIYLWHWPLVVVIYYFSLDASYSYPGIALSVLLGFLSYKYIEKIKFANKFESILAYLKCKPVYMALVIGVLGSIVFTSNGFVKLAPKEYHQLIKNIQKSPFSYESSPYYDKCLIWEYQSPDKSCEYFGKDVSWATFGDSHSNELSFALAEHLQEKDIGLKQFSFTACKPSYLQDENYSTCSKWYNESIEYIIKNKAINNVVVHHRYTNMLFGGEGSNYPLEPETRVTEDIKNNLLKFDKLILRLSSEKDRVFLFYPFPELQRPITTLASRAATRDESLTNIAGTSLEWYEKRNRHIINHFKESNYPDNVTLIDPTPIFCDSKQCFAVKEGAPLYFDDDHPSMIGARKLVGLMNLN